MSDNPFLLGRVVTNFQVKYDKNGKASYKWDEKEMTKFPKTAQI